MKRFYIIAFLMLAVAVNGFSRTLTIKLYDYQPSRSNGISEAEYTDERGSIHNITEPRLDVYLPDGAENVPCVMSIPGGGYKYVSARNEGSAVAENLISDNIAVAVLKYRLPNGHAGVPLADATRAMEIIRDSAVQWGIDSSRIGVIGFSAGGHLAACLLTKHKSPKSRPDFGILVYPVISLDSAITHKGSRQLLLGSEYPSRYPYRFSPEKHVSSTTPPCVIYACQDDKSVPVKNSMLMFEALTTQGVAAELHIYPYGGHGWGYTRPFPNRYDFERSVVEWIKSH